MTLSATNQLKWHADRCTIPEKFGWMHAAEFCCRFLYKVRYQNQNQNIQQLKGKST